MAAGACGESYEPPLPDRGQLHYPVGLTVHPNGRYLYVVNSNFNARFRADAGGTVSVIDTRTLEIQPADSPFLPSFGGAIELNDDATRAYVTAREDNTLVAFRVRPDGSQLFCLDEDEEPTSDPEPCSLRSLDIDGERARLATDPFGLAVSTVRRDDPETETDEEVPVDLVNVAYLGSENVSTISLPNRSLEAASLTTAALIAGGNRIQQRPGTLTYYVGGRNSNVVARFSPFVNFGTTGSFGEVEAIFGLGDITLSHFTSEGGGEISVDARGLAFNEAGDRLFVATRRPDALHVFDLIASNQETGGGLEHAWAGSVPLPDNPSSVVVHNNPRGRTLLYVPSFQEASISVVDPNSLTVLETIELDAGPYDLAIDRAEDRCRRPGDTCRAYVSLFDDTPVASEECGPETESCGTVAVIDLDPASPRYHRVIQKIH